jgi:hypothetical protein
MARKTKKKKKPVAPKAPTKLHLGVPQRRILRVGRNKPCPCGSGKKYKECHESEGETFLQKLTERREREERRKALKKAGVPWYKRVFS